jgi:hypothetical protein
MWCNSPPKRSHQLRYVLRNRATGETYLVILFTLYLKEDINEDGSLKQAAIESTGKQDSKTAAGIHKDAHDDHDENAALEAARGHFGARHGEGEDDKTPDQPETSADDVD